MVDYQIILLDSSLFEGINFVLKNAEQEVIGGIVGKAEGESVYIMHLWVGEEWQGQGLGTCLLQTLENEAKAQGFQIIQTDTYAWQAPVFYEKNGYTLSNTIKTSTYTQFFYSKEIALL